MIDTTAYLLPALVSVLVLIFYFVVSFNVGQARKKYKVPAPAITGHPDFERVFRVQQNTLEQLALFMPALWLFAVFVSPMWGAAFGVVWLIGRILYAIGYTKSAEKRTPGFMIGILAVAVLLLGTLGVLTLDIAHGLRPGPVAVVPIG
jgi:glutathione S-transferase